MADITKSEYEQAASLVKVQAILNIVFGGIGTLVSLLIATLCIIGLLTVPSDEDALGLFVIFVVTVFFGLLPHIFYVISGVMLLKIHDPSIVKVLTITNIVVSVFINFIVLIFAIISLAQSDKYTIGHKHFKVK